MVYKNGKPPIHVSGVHDLEKRELYLPPNSVSSFNLAPGAAFDNLPQAIQGYTHDIAFASSAQSLVSWSPGTITFYDGTTQAVSAAGSPYTLTSGSIYTIYFDLDDPAPGTLKLTTDYAGVMTVKTGALALVQRGSTAATNATIIPNRGKMPYLTADVIQQSSIAYDQIADGALYKKVLSTDITAGRIVLKSSTLTDGSVGLVSSTDLQAGRIVLKSSTIGDGTFSLDQVANSLSWAKVASTDISAGRIILRASTQTDGTFSLDQVASSANWGKIASTDLAAGHVKITSLVDNGGNPQMPARVTRGAVPPAGAVSGDIWIDTNNGDAPYTFDGWSWVPAYTQISGGRITTGTLDCSKVLVQSAGSGARCVINAAGLYLYGQAPEGAVRFLTPGGTPRGMFYSPESETTPGLHLQGYDNLGLETISGKVWCNSDFMPYYHDYSIPLDIGSNEYHWNDVYANAFYADSGNFLSFHAQPDIALVRGIGAKTARLCRKKRVQNGTQTITSVQGGVTTTREVPTYEYVDDKSTEREVLVIDPDTLPPELKDETGGMVHVGNMASLALGAIKMLAEKVDKLEAELAALRPAPGKEGAA